MFASEYSPKPTRLLGGLAMAAMLASCATTRPSVDLPELGGWEQRRELLGDLQEWEFRGRVGVSSGDDGFNASLRWAQDGDRFQATIGGPLGIGTVRLEGSGRQITLTDSDGNRTILEDAEAELYVRYGWTIPVQSLRYWALGIPDPELPAAEEFDDDGLLQSLGQGGWQVSIGRYGEAGGQLMPVRLKAVAEQASVRLAIHGWSFFDRP